MRRNGIVLTLVLTLGLIAGASPAAAGPVLPYNAHPRGHSYASWTRMVVAGFVTSVNSLTLDGKALPLKPIDTGAYDVISEPGSFYDTAVGIGTGPTRTALRANVVFLHPLTPGDHVMEAAVSFVGDGEFSAAYNVHVG